MKVCLDIEANGLINPTKVWLICCRDIDTGELHVFRKVTEDEREKRRFLSFASQVTLWVGHNHLSYDIPVMENLIGFSLVNFPVSTIDTLIISKLVDYSRSGHSIEDYGIEFNLPKGEFSDFSKYSEEMEEYCVRDVEIGHRIYNKYLRVINDPSWAPSILLEHKFQLVVNDLHNNGFSFNTDRASALLRRVSKDLEELDLKILAEFPPQTKMLREYTPKATKYGTISKTSIPRGITDLSPYEVGAPFCTFVWQEFNPSSPKQVVEVLNKAGWQPTEKTKTHIDNERELRRLKFFREHDLGLDLKIKVLYDKLELNKVFGWSISENNLSTLPPNAPPPARLLAKRILLESRRRTLTEWLTIVSDADQRIHGKFYGIGAWTHRMAHQNPNTANIPNEFDTQGKKKLLGKELRSLWQAPKNRLLVGVDAEGIQLRIFAHYIDDKEFTQALIEGKKEDKSDPHSLNQRILGSICKDRQAAKRFIYALLLGAGLSKLGQILEASTDETKRALTRLMERYTGFTDLKDNVFPSDAKRGWFLGLDGRKVRIPGETTSERRHLAMSGYLQNGEAVVMKSAILKWSDKLKDYNSKLVNFVHDEVIIETPNNVILAEEIQNIVSKSIEEVGRDLNLRCPLAGTGNVGLTWLEIH